MQLGPERGTMPLIDGIGDEILLAALAVTVAPLVVALSPLSFR